MTEEKTMLEYDIVESADIAILLEDVRKKISEGWEPIGGVSFGADSENVDIYLQSMIRREPPSAYYRRIAALKDGSAPVAMPDPNTVSIMDNQ